MLLAIASRPSRRSPRATVYLFLCCRPGRVASSDHDADRFPGLSTLHDLAGSWARRCDRSRLVAAGGLGYRGNRGGKGGGWKELRLRLRKLSQWKLSRLKKRPLSEPEPSEGQRRKGRGFTEERWCRRPDSNRYGLPHTPLKRARLPISPLRHKELVTAFAPVPPGREPERGSPAWPAPSSWHRSWPGHPSSPSFPPRDAGRPRSPGWSR